MGYFNRFLLFLYALAVALASLGLAALCLHLLPQAVIENEMAFLLSRWETLAGAAVAPSSSPSTYSPAMMAFASS